MKIHICVPIHRALDMLMRGKNIFDTSPQTAMKALTDARAEGKEFFTGCDNIKENGMCAGHES